MTDNCDDYSFCTPTSEIAVAHAIKIIPKEATAGEIKGKVSNDGYWNLVDVTLTTANAIAAYVEPV